MATCNAENRFSRARALVGADEAKNAVQAEPVSAILKQYDMRRVVGVPVKRSWRGHVVVWAEFDLP